MRAVSHGLPLKAGVRAGPAEIAAITSGVEGAQPVLFLHGFPTHGFLWRHVLHELGDEIHGLAPDLLGLGDTIVSPYEDFTAPMQAELLLEWLDHLGLERVAVVAHDQGGAVAQQLVANHPERVSHLPRRVAHNARIGFARGVRDSALMTPDVVEEYLRPLTTAEGRERARRFLLAADNRFTLECLPGLRAYQGPTLVAWGADDVFLSPSWGVRLVEDLSGAERLELLPFCGHLVPEERPVQLAALLRELLARPAAPVPG